MARRYEFFTGPCKWARLDQPDEKYNVYKINVYLDKANMQKFLDSGIGIKIYKDDEGSFVTFKRYVDRLLEGMEEKPKKLINQDGEYVPFDKLIGNGSIVTVKIEVYEGRKGIGHRLEAVAVEDLVSYEADEDQDLPF